VEKALQIDRVTLAAAELEFALVANRNEKSFYLSALLRIDR